MMQEPNYDGEKGNKFRDWEKTSSFVKFRAMKKSLNYHPEDIMPTKRNKR